MTTNQPQWRTIYQTDYSWLRRDLTGRYEPELLVAQEDDDAHKFYVHTIVLDRVDDADREWFGRSLGDVARSAGTTAEELRRQLASADPTERARAYEDIGGYHGLANFDDYPSELTEREFNAMWSRGRPRRRRAGGKARAGGLTRHLSGFSYFARCGRSHSVMDPSREIIVSDISKVNCDGCLAAAARDDARTRQHRGGKPRAADSGRSARVARLAVAVRKLTR